MATKALVTLEQPEDARRVRETGVDVLAEYPDSLLVRGTDAQVDRLTADGIESTPLPEEPVQVTGASFAFADAVRVNTGQRRTDAVARSAQRVGFDDIFDPGVLRRRDVKRSPK